MPPDGESSDDVKQSIRMTADRILAMPTKELGERKSRAGIVIPATAAQSRRLWAAVAGMTIPARLLRSPSSFVGSARMRSAVMRIDCLTSSDSPSGAIGLRGYRPPAWFLSSGRPRLDSPPRTVDAGDS